MTDRALKLAVMTDVFTADEVQEIQKRAVFCGTGFSTVADERQTKEDFTRLCRDHLMLMKRIQDLEAEVRDWMRQVDLWERAP